MGCAGDHVTTSPIPLNVLDLHGGEHAEMTVGAELRPFIGRTVATAKVAATATATTTGTAADGDSENTQKHNDMGSTGRPSYYSTGFQSHVVRVRLEVVG
jgi:hypothetical protein